MTDCTSSTRTVSTERPFAELTMRSLRAVRGRRKKTMVEDADAMPEYVMVDEAPRWTWYFIQRAE